MYTVNVVVSSSALSRFSISSSVGSGVSSLGAASPPPNFLEGVSCASRSMFQSNLPITRLDSSSDSMSTTSSVKSPSASASFASSVSSSSLSLMVNSLFCTMSAVLVSSRSGLSLFTTSANSWSSRPS